MQKKGNLPSLVGGIKIVPVWVNCTEILRKILICSLLIAMTGCEKISIDYRDPIIGKYKFAGSTTIHIHSGNTITEEFTFSGEIAKGNSKNTVLIYYSGIYAIEPYLFEDGTIYRKNWHAIVLGEFETNSKLTFSNYNFTLGSNSVSVVTGEKE